MVRGFSDQGGGGGGGGALDRVGIAHGIPLQEQLRRLSRRSGCLGHATGTGIVSSWRYVAREGPARAVDGRMWTMARGGDRRDRGGGMRGRQTWAGAHIAERWRRHREWGGHHREHVLRSLAKFNRTSLMVEMKASS